MKRLDRLTADPKQRYSVPLDDGGSFTLYLQYLPRQQMWMANVSQGDFVANGILLTTYPNVMRQYRNLIQVGIAVLSDDATDPRYVDDFVTGRIRLYVLNADDVQAVEDDIFS